MADQPVERPDTSNKFGVGVRVGADGREILILNPPRAPLTRDEALNLAAWIVAMVGDRVGFAELLAAILRT